MSEQSSDQRVWSWKRSPSYLGGVEVSEQPLEGVLGEVLGWKEHMVIVGDPSKIRPYSSSTGLLLSLFSLTAFSSRKPKNKRKAE